MKGYVPRTLEDINDNLYVFNELSGEIKGSSIQANYEQLRNFTLYFSLK